MSNKTKILFVEHDPSDLELIQYELRRSGINFEAVVVVNEGAFSLAIKSFLPDIILSDFSLPSFSGPSAFKVRQQLAPDTPFIFVSGTIGEEHSIEFIRNGVTDYVLKDKLYTLDIKIKRALRESIEKQERKKVEQERIKSELRLKEAQTLAQIGSWEIEIKSKEHHWSDEMFSILGIKSDNVSPSLELLFSCVHPDDVLVVRKAIRQGYETLTDSSFAFRFVRNGATRHAICKYRFEVDSAGKALRTSGVVQDVTDRKEAEEQRALDTTARVRAEKELIVGEQRFRALIDNSADAILLSADDSKILYQSPSVTKILGYSAEERSGRAVKDYIHVDDLGYFARIYKEVKDSPGQPIPFQYRVRHKHGHYVWLEGVITNLLLDPSVNAFVANYRDITQRKVTEQNLEMTLTLFEKAQEIGHLGHWHADFRSQQTSWSDEAFRIFGIEPGSIAPSEELFQKYIHRDDLSNVKLIMQQGMQTAKSFSFFHRIVLDTGAVRNMFSVGQFEFDDSHHPIGLNGITQDITELTEKENALEQANNELETFIYKTSHDLRAPNSTIIGLVNVANAEATDAPALKYFNMIKQIAIKQNRMLQNLATVMTTRSRKLKLESIELNSLLGEVITSLRVLPSFGEVSIVVDNQLKDCVNDRELVYNILFNLIENSIQYRDPIRAKPEVRITLRPKGSNFIEVEVKDNGVGMSRQVKDRIFDMFFRGNEVSQGSGLGLYLVKSAVAKLGGTITVSTTSNVGSTFCATIPCYSLAEASSQAAPADAVNLTEPFQLTSFPIEPVIPTSDYSPGWQSPHEWPGS